MRERVGGGIREKVREGIRERGGVVERWGDAPRHSHARFGATGY
jgi:hypothetical protein